MTGTSYIDISDSPDALRLFKEFLTDEKSGGDPLVYPYFGDPDFPYIPTNAQNDVWSLLATFSKLMASDFAVGAPQTSLLAWCIL